MKTLSQQLVSYAAYHKDPRNQLTHFIGVPLIVFSVFLILSQWSFGLSLSLLFASALAVYYVYLSIPLGLFVAVFLFLGDWIAESLAPSIDATKWGTILFILGWVIQFIGHWFEGKRPALFDNILQVFNAPLFLGAEVLFRFGWGKEIRQEFETEKNNRV